MPRLAGAILLLTLAALAGTMSYTAYLVVSIVADFIGTGRFVAGLLMGIIFARLPAIREGKLRTIGLLPKSFRLPVMLALLAFCMLGYFQRGEPLTMAFLGFAAIFLLAFPRIRNRIADRVISPFFKSPGGSRPSNNADDTVIDVKFREKKD